MAEVYAHDTLLNASLLAQLVLCFTTLSLLTFIATRQQYRRIIVHTNMKILFVNVAIICGVVSVFTSVWVIRFQIFRFFSSDPCSLLIPVWFSVVVRFPTYIYGTGFPLWHLAMTVERLLSTLQAAKYEYARPIYSIVASAAVWLLTIAHTSYATWLALQDPNFSGDIVYATLSTATNAEFLTETGHVMVALDLSTMFLDGVTILLNRRMMKKVTTQYSLSRSYQISENLIVTKRLVLPLDISNAICYFIYQGGITTARHFRLSLSPHRFQSLIETFYVLVLLQAPISLMCLILYAKNQRRKLHVVSQSEEMELYFSQLRNQLGTERKARTCQWSSR